MPCFNHIVIGYVFTLATTNCDGKSSYRSVDKQPIHNTLFSYYKYSIFSKSENIIA